MHFTSTILTTLLAIGYTSASPITEPESVEIEARAVKMGHSCAGDYDGSPLAALACVDTKWNSKQKVSVQLSVRDSKKDGHPTYGWYRVYWADGVKKDFGQLKNNGGNGHTVWSSWKNWNRSGIEITGVRVWACVDKTFDSCESGDFLNWGEKED